MAKVWVFNNTTGPRTYYGELLQAGEGAWVEDGTAPGPSESVQLNSSERTTLRAWVSGDGIVACSAVNSAEARVANSLLIAAALALGACYVTGGAVYVSTPVVINKDRQRLRTAPGTRILNPTGTESVLLKTAGADDPGAPVTVTWTAGNVATMSGAAALNLGVGDGVILQGAAEDKWRAPVRVIAVSGDNATIQLKRRVTAGPTGSITAWRCLRDVEIDADLDYNWNGVTTSSGTINRHCAALLALADSKLRIRGHNAYKYTAMACGVLNCDVEFEGDNVSDIGKLYGPAADCRTSVAGVSRDDSGTMQCQEPSAFAGYQRFVGPIYDCGMRLSSSSSATGSSSSAAVLYLDPVHEPDNITFSGSVSSQIAGGFSIKAGDTFTPANCKAGLVTVEGMTIAPKAGEYAATVSACVRTLRFKRPRIVPGDTVTQLWRFENTSDVDSLVVEDWDFNDTNWPSNTSAFAFNLNGTNDEALYLNHRVVANATNFRHTNVGTGGPVKKVVFRGGAFENGNCLVLVPTGVTTNPVIVFDGASIKGFTNLVRAQAACTVVLRNCDIDTVSFVVATLTNAINAKIVDGGGNKFTSAPLFQCSNGSTVTFHGFDLPVTLGTGTAGSETAVAGVQKTVVGQHCRLLTAVGTIPANSLAVCDGTNWRAVHDRTLLW